MTSSLTPGIQHPPQDDPPPDLSRSPSGPSSPSPISPSGTSAVQVVEDGEVEIKSEDGPDAQNQIHLVPIAEDDAPPAALAGPSDNIWPSAECGKPSLYFQPTYSPFRQYDSEMQEPDSAIKTAESDESATASTVPPTSTAGASIDTSSEADKSLDRRPKRKYEQFIKTPTNESQALNASRQSKATADNCPWSGTHAEDRLTEQVVKNGYSEKGYVLNEMNSARSSLWPLLKNKSGLQTLSHVFISSLKQRQEHGRVTATSTFKPPPRVTLTDTKREQWLRDLSNASVPLRRLSRTIPHGIRGKHLLEQCLQKHVPVARAVWFAKCVGANEMRAFRRKGISGALVLGNELKWVKEWTGFVEEFIETTINACGQPDWKKKMNYVIQLSAHLYSQRLLDLEHFLGWMLGFFEACDADRLPAALVFIRIYWRDITANGPRGRRLTNAILERLHLATNHIDADLFHPVTSHLRRLVQLLLTRSPSCALVPKKWKQYRPLLVRMRDEAEGNELDAFTHIIQRNDRITQQSIGGLKTSKSTPLLEEFVASLDAFEAPHDIDKLPTDNLLSKVNLEEIMANLLQWASSIYSSDRYSVYIAVSLIRNWRSRGLNTDAAILEALERLRNHPGVDARRISRIIANLVKSGDFNVGRYMQWLIATGALAGCDLHRVQTSCDVRPLIDIPLSNLTRNVINLRQTLLRSTSITAESEARVVGTTKRKIESLIPELFMPPPGNSEFGTVPSLDGFSELSMSVTAEITVWMRQSINVRKENNYTDSDKFTAGISYRGFLVLRKILESFQDFSDLAELCLIMTKTNDTDLIIALLDTLLLHLQVFSALNSATRLFSALVERYRALKLKRPPQKDIVTRILDLCGRLSVDAQLLRQFQRELALCDQGPSLAAPSPVSEGMVEDAKESGADFVDEIERLLTSGTSMDNQTFSTVFGMITSHLQLAKESDQERIVSLGSSMCKLKSFDEEYFGKLALDWVSKILVDDSKTFERCVPVLVGSGCCSLTSILQSANVYFNENEIEDPEVSGGVAFRLLDLFTRSDSDSRPYDTREQYRFRLERDVYFAQNPVQIIGLLRRALQQPSQRPGSKLFPKLQALISSQTVLGTVRRLGREDQGALFKELDKFSNTDNLDALQDCFPLLNGLVDPSGSLNISNMSSEDKIAKIFAILDAFSLPYYQASLRGLVGSIDYTTSPQCLTETLLAAIQASISRNCPLWPKLLSVLNVGILRPIREYSEERIFQASESLLLSASGSDKRAPPVDFKALLSVVEATATSIPEAGLSNVAANLLTQFRMLTQRAGYIATQDDGNTASSLEGAGVLNNLLNALLRLAIIHAPSFSHAKPGVSDIVALLHILSHLLAADQARPLDLPKALVPSTLEHVFDVASAFTSDLSDTTVAQLTRDLAPFSSDPRICFLFGFNPNPDAWLSLSQPVPASPAAAAKPTTSSPSPIPTHQQPILGSVKHTPFPLRRWELFSDSAPNPGENDTALSLRLFDARRVL